MNRKIYLFCFLLLLFAGANAQTITVKGTVTDKNTGEEIPGVTIVRKGTAVGTSTGLDGKYLISVPANSILVFSSVGYTAQEVAVSEAMTVIDVVLDEETRSLSDIVVVGSRFRPRSEMASPVPIDNVSAQDLESTGQLSLDQMINYKVQSYNAATQTISDATAHFNPADLRGLGPGRTLVLINGKRKNASALVYINDTPGKGEVGVDMQSIPTGAVERIEVLRDGASAQYGSDAIAGVINIVLKENTEKTSVDLLSGVTTKGDGFNYGFSANTGFNLPNDGYVNVTAAFKHQEKTNRPGEPGDDKIFGQDSSNPWIQKNKDLKMTVGSPEMTAFEVFYNAGVPFKNGQGKIYSFGGTTYRRGKSFAIYRTPYFVKDPHNIFHKPGTAYNGFQPTFETDIYDHTLGFGVQGNLAGWDVDLSSTRGSNSVDYTIGNTLNPSLKKLSPTRFSAGGYKFSNIVNNLDVFRSFGKFSLGFGSEMRTERFVAKEGEPASYAGSGAQSFPGLRPSNKIDKTRFNIGFYTDLEFETGPFLLGGAMRFEKYADFGNTFNWKLNSRLRLLQDKLSLRGSLSTGFRAPSLHQIYLSNIQTLVTGGTLSEQGTFNNQSPVIRGLAVPALTQEKSLNLSAGFTLNPVGKLEITADYYNIAVNDRIVFTSSIGFDKDDSQDNAVEKILKEYNVMSIKFFTNAVDTRTQGVDVVVGYSGIPLGAGTVNLNLAANFNQTKIEGAIATPEPIKASGNEIFDRKEQSRIVSARPKDKILFGVSYNIKDFSMTLNNTRFGEVTWRHAQKPQNDQTFSAKIVTDLNLSYKFSAVLRASLLVNNLLNVYPDPIDTKGDFVTDLGGRFKYPWEVNQFGFMGTVLSGRLSFTF